MLRRAMVHRWAVLTVGAIVAAAVVIPVYAHCGKCATSAKEQAEALNKSKMTLAAAATLGEVATKGTAVRAVAHEGKDGPDIHVYCVVDGKIMAVTVDAKTGKVGEPKAVKDLEEHPHA